MKVAPYDSCVVCWKGDTTTGLVAVGTLEWAVGTLIHVGVPEDEAAALVKALPQNDPELARQLAGQPLGEREFPIRVCADCATKVGVQVGDLSVGRLPAYVEKGE